MVELPKDFAVPTIIRNQPFYAATWFERMVWGARGVRFVDSRMWRRYGW